MNTILNDEISDSVLTTSAPIGLVPAMPNDKRIIPNDLIRSSLFTVSNHNKAREFIKDRNLYTFGATKITYTGEELRQDDEDVWLQLIYLFAQTSEQWIEFMPYTLMRELSWPGRTQYCEKLKASIMRMSATNLTVSNEEVQAGLSLSLVRKFMWKQDNGKKLKLWRVWLEPEMIKLFEGMKYSKIMWEQRKKLNPLAKWLHAYYSSHAEPFPIRINTIQQACGSKMQTEKHFKLALRRALESLVLIGFLQTYFIDAKNLVYVQRVKKLIYA